MWMCLSCILRLLGGDSRDLNKYFMSSLHNAKCDKCNKTNITVDWIGEVDINYLEARNERTQKPRNCN